MYGNINVIFFLEIGKVLVILKMSIRVYVNENWLIACRKKCAPLLLISCSVCHLILIVKVLKLWIVVYSYSQITWPLTIVQWIKESKSFLYRAVWNSTALHPYICFQLNLNYLFHVCLIKLVFPFAWNCFRCSFTKRKVVWWILCAMTWDPCSMIPHQICNQPHLLLPVIL